MAVNRDDINQKLIRLNRKVCCLNKDIDNLLPQDILDALNGAASPSETNVFATIDDLLDIGVGTNIFLITNYSSLPPADFHSGEFYWVENSQGTQWLPGSLGGTYYPKGLYYSNGVTWNYADSPYQATIVEVNNGLNDNKFVTPLTFDTADKWGTKANVSHTHVIADVTGLQTALDLKLETIPSTYITESELATELSGYVENSDTRLTDSRTPTAHTHTVSEITDFTESVEDIIGTKVVAGTDITVSYNDTTGVTTINSTSVGVTDHTLLTNIGTNTHAQIDTHIANTSNPHNVTKTQVGLSNVNNTSDLAKPISTATQSALDGKADLSHTHIISDTAGLQTALDSKIDENVAITPATSTKVTYDSKGLITSGTSATTADIADSLNKRYLTDSQLTVVGNTSGTNTGDNAVNSLYSGLVSNQTHTDEVTGSTALTVQKEAILNKTVETVASTDYFLFSDTSDSGNLKKGLVSSIITAGPAGKGFNNRGTWSGASVSYVNNSTTIDTVFYNGTSYQCILSHTSAGVSEPGVGGFWTTYWAILAQKGDNGKGFNLKGAWDDSETNYVNNSTTIDTVTHNGATYYCILSHSADAQVNDEPGVGSSWQTFWSLFVPISGGATVITNTNVLNFGNEEDTAVNTIANLLITNANVRSASFIPIETTETSLDDFKLNGVSFNIENIIDNTSFDIRGTALNNASGNYTIKYIIAI